MADLSGGVHLCVEMKIDHEQLATWSPDRIKAFFAGVALVLAARDGVTWDVSLAAIGAGTDGLQRLVGEAQKEKERTVLSERSPNEGQTE